MANVAAYAKIPGINGDSVEPHHIQWIELLSVDWRGPNSGRFATSAARETTVGGNNDIRVTKLADVASARLYKAAARGAQISHIDLELANVVRVASQAGGEVNSHLVLLLKNVFVRSIQTANQLRAETITFTETITFNFGSVQFTYR